MVSSSLDQVVQVARSYVTLPSIVMKQIDVGHGVHMIHQLTTDHVSTVADVVPECGRGDVESMESQGEIVRQTIRGTLACLGITNDSVPAIVRDVPGPSTPHKRVRVEPLDVAENSPSGHGFDRLSIAEKDPSMLDLIETIPVEPLSDFDGKTTNARDGSQEEISRLGRVGVHLVLHLGSAGVMIGSVLLPVGGGLDAGGAM